MWLPTSRDEKYKAKQAVDTFFVRIGDVVSAGVVLVGTTWLALDVRGFALANVALTVAWIALATRILRRYPEVAKEA
jgi:AAA family ATP:ADP antiporter